MANVIIGRNSNVVGRNIVSQQSVIAVVRDVVVNKSVLVERTKNGRRKELGARGRLIRSCVVELGARW